MNLIGSKWSKRGVIISLLSFLALTIGFFWLSDNEVMAAAGVPKILNYQSRLLNSSSVLLGGSTGTNFCFKFSLYDSPTVGSGNKLWPAGSPATTTVLVKNGIFDVGIGDTSNGGDLLDYNFNDSDTIYLNVQVANSIGGLCTSNSLSFENLSPRKRVYASGYAINSSTVGGFTPAQSASSSKIAVLTGDNLILGGTNPQINATGTNHLIIQAGGGTGFVGIGTTTPGAFFSVQGNGLFSGNLNLASLTATDTITASNLAITGSTTLQNFTALNSTTSNSTSTSFFASLFNSTNATSTSFFASILRATAALFTNSTSTSLSVSGLSQLGTTTITNLSVTNVSTSTFAGAITVGVGQGTSTFAGAISAAGLALTGNGTSTAANGINLSNGCFAISGTCISTGSGSVANGTAGQLAYYSTSGSLLSGTSSIFISTTGTTTGFIGIGTTTPQAKLTVAGGGIYAENLIFSGSYGSIMSAVVGSSTGYTNFSGGIGTGGSDSINNPFSSSLRITSAGNLVNIGSIQAGETLLTSAGTFAGKVDFSTGSSPDDVRVGDLDGDGRPDIVVVAGTNNISVYRNLGNGAFSSAVNYTTGSSPEDVSIGDVNGDGKPDLVTANNGTNTLSVFLNNGNGTFASKVDYTTGTNPYNVAIGDVNGDGKADLVAGDTGSNAVSVLINQGNGTFAPKVDYTVGTGPRVAALGDFNGDGKADIAVVNTVNGVGGNSVSVLINQGNGTFFGKVDYTTGTSPDSLAVGDLNGDGILDIATENAVANSVSVLINNGNGTFASKVDYTSGTQPRSMAIGDLNGDGRVDLAVGNDTSGTVSVFLNKGDGTFNSKVDYTVGSSPYGTAIGDINGDGKLDIVTANLVSSTFSVLLNQPQAMFYANASSGNVGIGTSTPTSTPNALFAKLTVWGADSSATGRALNVVNSASSTLFTVTNSGNVGVGTTSPYSKFTVAGETVASYFTATSTLTASTLPYASSTAISASGLIQAANFLATASSTFQNLTALNSTTTNSTSTSLFASILQATNSIFGNSTSSNFFTTNEVNTNATSTSFFASILRATAAIFTNSTSTSLSVSGLSQLGTTTLANLSVTGTATSTFTGAITVGAGQGTSTFAGSLSAAGLAITGNGTSTFANGLNLTNGCFSVLGTCVGSSGSSVPSGTAGQLPFYATNGSTLTATSSIFLSTTGTTTGNIGIGTTTPQAKLTVAGGGIYAENLIFSGSYSSIMSAVVGSSTGYTNFTGGIGTGGSDSINNAFNSALRITSAGNLVNIGSVQAGETLLTSAGTFAPKVDLTGGTNPTGVQVGDFNGDGLTDVVAVNNGAATVSVFMNLGNGRFASKIDYTTDTAPRNVTVGDFNGDGKPDFAVVGSGANFLSVFINRGDGTFFPKVDYVSGTQPYHIASGDVNGDGKTDIVVADYNGGATSAFDVFINSGNGTFPNRAQYVTGNGPVSIALGDLNGDGKADAVVTNDGSNTASVFMNNGDGTFASKVDYATGANPEGVAIADLNGDGKLDFAIPNIGTNTVSVFINNGNGTFASKVDYTVGTGPSAVAVADLNGDGRPDLVAANYTAAAGTTVSVLMNNGGTFNAKVDYTVGTAPTGVAIADFNGDGKKDIVVANQSSNTVSVLLNQPQAMFYANASSGNVAIGTSTPTTTPNALFAKLTVWGADALSTGRAFLVSNSASSTLFTITNSGNVGIGTTTPASLFSVQGNGLFSGNVNLASLSATGTLNVTGLTSLTGAASTTLLSVLNTLYVGSTATSTINGNNGLSTLSSDLSVSGSTTLQNFTALNSTTSNSTSTSFFASLFNSTNATSTSFFASVLRATSALFTNATSTSLSVSGLSQLGTTTITNLSVTNVSTSTFAGAITVGAGQGTSTFAGSISAAGLAITGNGTSTAANGINLSSGCFAISGTCVGSSGGSGTVSAGTAGQIAYYASSGSTVSGTSSITFASNGALTISATSSFYGPIGVGTTSPRFSLDVASTTRTANLITSNLAFSQAYGSILSAIVGSSTGYTNFSGGIGTGGVDSVVGGLRLTNSGNLVNLGSVQAGETSLSSGGTFAPATDFPTSNSSGNQGVAIGDLNGDGKNDFIVVMGSLNQMDVFISRLNGTFASTTYTTGSSPKDVAIGDLNGDGKPDIAVADSGANTISVFINNGNGTFAPKVDYTTGAGSPNYIAIGDLNGDGRNDIATTNGGSFLSLFYNKGDGTFPSSGISETVPSLLAGSAPKDIAIGDLNGDGRADIVTANSSESNVGIFLNMGNGNFASQITTGVGGSPDAVAIADLNGDGINDIVAANSSFSAPSISILYNGGNGIITSSSTATVSGSFGPNSVAVGDLNGDGRNDIAVSIPNTSNDIFVFMNQGNGTFPSSGTAYSTTNGFSNYIALGDLNGDGKADILTSASTNDKAYILYNQPAPLLYASALSGNVAIGTSTATSTQSSLFAKLTVWASTTANGTALNVVSSASSSLFTVGNNGNVGVGTSSPGSLFAISGIANFTTATSTLYSTTGGINLNGGCFAISGTCVGGGSSQWTTSGSTIYYNSGSVGIGTTTPVQKLELANNTGNGHVALRLDDALNSHSFSIGAGQVNPFLEYSDNIVFLKNTYSNVGNGGGAEVMRLTSTGNLGIGTSSPGAKLSIAGAASPAGPVLLISTSTASATSTAIVVDSNGFLGIATTSPGSLFSVSGVTNFTTATSTFYGSGGINLTAGCFAVSGTCLSSSGGSGTVSAGTAGQLPFYATNGSTLTATSSIFLSTTGTTTGNIGIGTTTPQAKLTVAGGGIYAENLIFSGSYGSIMSAVVGSSTGYTNFSGGIGTGGSDSINNAFNSALRITSAGNLVNIGSVQAGETLLSSAGTFAASSSLTTATGPVAVLVTDTNGDGKADIVAANITSNSISNFINQGNGTFASKVDYTTGTNPYIEMASGDFNGDGKVDIVTANNGANTVSILMNNGNGTFASKVDYTTGVNSQPVGVAVGDLNGDGKPDLAVVGGPGKVITLFNNGAGTFSSPTSYTSSGVNSDSIAIGDFNGDGKADIAVVNDDGSVGIFLNNGDGTLGSQTTYPTASGQYMVAVGDLNGDGIPDLAVTATGKVSVFINNGNGTFASRVDYTAGTGASHGLSIVDVNGDGRPDLVTANFNDGIVSVLTNKGNGNFSAATSYNVGTHPQGIAVGDLNGDGKPDIAAANQGSNTVTVYLNQSTPLLYAQAFTGNVAIGTSTAATSSSLFAKLTVWGANATTGTAFNIINSASTTLFTVSNGGLVGIGTTSPLAVLSISATSTASNLALLNIQVATTTGAATSTAFIVSANGNVGIATTTPGSLFAIDSMVNFTNSTSTFYSTGGINLSSGCFAISGTCVGGGGNSVPSGTAGQLPFYATNGSTLTATSSIFLSTTGTTTGNIGIGTTTPQAKLTVAGGGIYAENLIFSGSYGSIMSAVVGSSTGYTNFTGGIGTGGSDSINNAFNNALRITSAGNLVNIGSVQAGETLLTSAGTFAGKSDLSTGSTPYGVLVADVNGDGKADLVNVNNSSNTLSIFRNLGNGTFAAKVDFNTDVNPRGLASGDFNGDGLVDFVVSNETSSTLNVFRNLGNGAFASTTLTTGTTPEVVAVGDLNGDGKPDIAVADNGAAVPAVSVFLNNGNGTFAPKVDYTTGSSPWGVAIGDFNGDGKADLAVTNSSSNTVSIFLNNGSGTFASKIDFTTGSAPREVATADFNGDGRLDLVVANGGASTVSVFLNNGLGGGTSLFSAKTDYTASNNAFGMAVADVNGDGKVDILSANSGGNSVSVLQNKGDGTFFSAVNYTTGSAPRNVAVGDLNGDGKPEIITANGSSATLSVFLNQSTPLLYAQAFTGNVAIGTSTAATSSSLFAKLTVWGANATTGTAFNIINSASTTLFTVSNGGLVGIGTTSPLAVLSISATSTASNLALLNIQVATTTGAATSTAFIVSANGNVGIATTTPGTLFSIDGFANFSNATSTFYSTGGINLSSGCFAISGSCLSSGASAGTQGQVAFYNTTGSTLSGTSSLFIAQSGNIGIGTTSPGYSLDIASTTRTTNLITQNLTLSSSYSSILSAVVGSSTGYTNFTGGIGTGGSDSINNAFNNALRITSTGNLVNIGSVQAGETLLTSAGAFASKVDFNVGTTPQYMAIGDMNGDGREDLVIANRNSANVTVYFNNGDGTYSSTTPAASVSFPTGVAIGDFNGDGKADIAVTGLGSTVGVILNNGNGGFSSAVTYSAGVSGAYAVAVGDLNGDGKPDLVIGDNSSGGIGVLLNNGNGTFASAVNYGSGIGAFGIAIADFNGDGRADIAAVDVNSSIVAVFTNTGNGTFSSRTNYAVGSTPEGIVAGDLDGDGKPDLAVANHGADTMSILLNTGTSTGFATQVTYSTGSGNQGIALGDVNGDGKPDIAVVNNTNNNVSIFRNLGNGTFASRVNYTTGSSPFAVAIGDLNGDGKADVAVTNQSLSSVSVLLNQSTPLLYAQAFTGNVAIGTSTAATSSSLFAKLTVWGANATTGTAFNIINSASTTLFTVSNGGLVGIGTTSPLAVLSISATSTASNLALLNIQVATTTGAATSTAFIVSANGNVGIATTTPGTLFSIDGFANFSNATSTFYSTGGINLSSGCFAISGTCVGGGGSSVPSGTAGQLPFYATNGSTLTATSSIFLSTTGTTTGNIGIGTTTPQAKLTVAGGGIYAENLIFSGSYGSIMSAVVGSSTGYTNFTGGIGTGGSDSINNAFNSALRITSAGNLVNIGSVQAGETLLSSGGVFSTRTDFTTGSGPQGIVIADFNGDGKPDVAVANSGNNISVFMNQGGGSFATKVDYSDSAVPNIVKAADLNGDGKPDLVVANQAGSAISVFINRGDGTFFSQVNYTTGSGPFAVAIGDLNGDGKPDLAVTNQNTTNTLSILFNRGDGTFTSKTDYPTGTNPFGVAIGDVNGDGKADVVVANNTSNTVSVFLNTGSGVLASKVDYTAGTNPYELALVDLNGDGRLDIVTSDEGAATLSVFINQGGNSLSNNDGAFSAKSDYTANSLPWGLTVGDVNGDGRPDVVLGYGSGNVVSVYMNKGDGTLASKVDYVVGNTGSQPEFVAVGDLNNDGKLDIVATKNGTANFGVILNQPIPLLYAQAFTGNVAIGTSTAATSSSLFAKLTLWASSTPNGTALNVVSAASSTLFTITNSGLVGIGTTSPLAVLSISATSTASNLALLNIQVATTTGAATSTAFIVASNGRVGIATSSPAYTLDVDGDVNVSSGRCFRINGVCIGYTVKLAVTYATSSSGTTSIAFTGAANTASFTNPPAGQNYGTTTLPSNTSYFITELWGAGGGGAGGSSNQAPSGYNGGGGGGGGYAEVLTKSPTGTTYYATVGSGGAGTVKGASGAQNGGDGLQSCFGTNSTNTCSSPLAQANGGFGGGGTGVAGGGGGAAGTGDVTLSGGDGGVSFGLVSGTTNISISGSPGGSGARGGGGGAGGSTTHNSGTFDNGSNGNAFGGGGGGGGNQDTGTGTATGGNGGPGGMVITVYATSSPNVTGNDYAEMFPVDNLGIGPADIVAVNPGAPVSMGLATRDSAALAGVIATAPGQVLGDQNALGMRPVALSGRVPVKVSLENGDIKIGDRIALSSVPGVGMKADEFDASVGIALENYTAENSSSGQQTITMFVNIQRGIDTHRLAEEVAKITANNFTFSDSRVKTTSATTTVGLDDLMRLNVQDFSRADDPNHATTTGFIAQQLYTIYPWAVITNGDNGIDALSPTSTPWSVDYGRVTPLLAKSIQELNIKLEDLTSTTSTSTDSSSFSGRFFSNLFNKITAWLGDMSNGLADIFASRFHAKEELCIGETCVNEQQLKKILEENSSSSNLISPSPIVSESTPTTSTPETTDIEAPVLHLIGSATSSINLNSSYVDPGATVTDNVDHNLGVTTTGSVDTSKVGNYTLTYDAEDSAGNKAVELTRVVTVVDPAGSTSPITSDDTSTTTATSTNP